MKHEFSKTCVYDNPATMCREAYGDGQLLCHFSIELFCLPLKHRPKDLYIFWGHNIGTWETGRVWGDKKAMDSLS